MEALAPTERAAVADDMIPRPPDLPSDVMDAVLRVEPDDAAPAYVQLKRRVRVAVADGVLQPGDRLPSVRALARRLGLSTNTVGRAYADLAREGVITARGGGGSEVAPRERLDRPALVRERHERLRLLARQMVVRGLAVGLDGEEIVHAVRAELAARGHPVPAADGAPHASLGAGEGPLLSARNLLHGTVAAIRDGEMVCEVTIALSEEVRSIVVAVTRSSITRLALEVGSPVTAYVKATEPVLGP